MKRLSALIMAVLVFGGCSDSEADFEFTYSTDACFDGRVPTSRLVAVDIETGSELWSQRVPYNTDPNSQFQLAGDRLVFTFGTAAPSGEPAALWFGGIAALSTAGEPIWQEVAGRAGPFAVSDGVAAVLAYPGVSGRLELGIDITDGRELWSRASDGFWFSLLTEPITLFAEDNTIRAVEVSTGDELWSYGSDGVSSWGSLSVDGRAVVPVGESTKYIDIELATGEAIEIDTASGGEAVRVIALTPDVIVGHEEWWAEDGQGKTTVVQSFFGYDRASGREVWHRDVANAYGSVWVGDYIVKPGRNIRVFDIDSGAQVAKIPAGRRDKFEFAQSRQKDILIGYDGVIASYADGQVSDVLIGAATQGAWEVDEDRTLVASTRLDGGHQVAMMDDDLKVGLWAVPFDMPADHVLLGEDAAYVVMSESSCASF